MIFTEENLISFSSMTKEEFDDLNHKFLQDKSITDFVQFSYQPLNQSGIFYNNKLIGMVYVMSFIDETLAVSIALLKEYRGLGISQVAYEKLIDLFGEKFSDYRAFVLNIAPNNIQALKSVAKTSFRQSHEFDEIMMEEGAEYFYTFFKDNPYYMERKVGR